MDKTIETKLQEWFGYASFRTGQKETINSILSGENAIAVLPTGTGKSLIYQFCGYWKGGLTLVVSPLLSLMENQVMQMKTKGEKRVAALNSMMPVEERRYVMSHLSSYRFLFVSPEMLQYEHLLNLLQRVSVELFVVDEAHCISQWGLDFRPEYLNLGKVRQELGNPLTLALTATASEKIIADVFRYLHLDEKGTEVHRFDPNRRNIYYDIRPVERKGKAPLLLELLQQYPAPGIIYFASKAVAEEVNQLISSRTHLRSDTYHADRSNEDRTAIQHQFIAGELDVICATSAFGMGINKLDIRFVIHYHSPATLEEYLQETGRAGRDGRQSVATLLYHPNDIHFRMAKVNETDISPSFLREWVKGKMKLPDGLTDSDSAMLQAIRNQFLSADDAQTLMDDRRLNRLNQLQNMKGFAETISCKRMFLSHHFGHSPSEFPEWCCSFCQPDISPLLKELRTTMPFVRKETTSDLDWKEKLNLLFLFQK